MAKKRTSKEGAVATAEAPKRQVSIRVPSTKSRTRKPSATSAGNGNDGRTEIVQEIIAVRAYFISEQRLAAGLAGDSFGDWLEAERQLREEKHL